MLFRSKEIRKERQTLLIAKDQADRADLAGDQAAFDKATERTNTARTNLANMENKITDQINSVMETGKKAEYDLYGKKVIQAMDNEGRIRAARAGNPGITQAIANAQNELTAARTQHANQYGRQAVREAQARVTAYKNAVAKGKTPPKGSIMEQAYLADKQYLEKYAASEKAIADLEAMYRPYIKWLGDQSNMPENVVNAISRTKPRIKLDAQGNPL